MSSAPAVDKQPLPPTSGQSFSDAYNRWFEVIPADTAELREKVFRLRYQVYCCEHRYEIPEEHPHKMEMDEFDCQSIHSLVLDRFNGAAMGTVRLILSNGLDRNAGLPIQNLCRCGLPTGLLQSNAAEISRFAISKDIRGMDHGGCPKELKCSLVLGLMRAVVQMSIECGITDWLAVMEPALLRLLGRFGVHFIPIGPLVEYHGVRQPCHANVAELLDTVRSENFPLYEFVTELSSWPVRTASAASF